jgi:uncharacterized protein YPO0396
MKLTKKEVEEILKKRVSDFNEKLRKVAEEGLRTFATSDYQLRIGDMKRDLNDLWEDLEGVQELYKTQWGKYYFILKGYQFEMHMDEAIAEAAQEVEKPEGS